MFNTKTAYLSGNYFKMGLGTIYYISHLDEMYLIVSPVELKR